MIYHTNHSWCSSSIWGGECFDGEVIVSLSRYIDTDSISEYTHKIIDPDFNQLTEYKKFFDKEEALQQMKVLKEIMTEKGEEFNEDEFLSKYKELSRRKTITLKSEIIDWLNENIRDRVITYKETKSPLANTKGWAIGDDKYNSSQSYELNIFFARQIDALKFIRKFSIFKDPTFYFDYFHDERRELEANLIIDIINKNTDLNLDVTNYDFINKREEETSTNLDPNTFILLDWEKDSDDIELTEKELKKAIEEIQSVD